MGWLFGKKKSRVKSPSIGGISHEQSLSFNDSAMHDKVLHPDSVKAAAGVHDEGLSFDEGLSDSPLGASPAPIPSRPMPVPKMVPEGEDSGLGVPANPALRPMSAPSSLNSARGSDLYVKVHDYKRILGELKNLGSELSSLGKTTKALEHSEYNEEKSFVLMKDTVKKVHDKLLVVDRTLFSN